ncbi:MAG: hypothetical protein A3C07_03875 [Candidatus Sungbacteria bacterium RIFCSPHIGHO2_02_FULL_47_11]|uniref:Zinc-binding domain-containing protein n=1 Tax=Candidatus Sungbacteria bacterium RIFCSPHIGHO2_02_FULL_47_11 TaxID=1802270 RepID=A0A1G2KGJ9_9BACT|nr:MAG: hypothetical protein A3C07_03875 [Candidatus Sungbacteria bacterium RIFCSPHIGHO2_02_FULL_47_11]
MPDSEKRECQNCKGAFIIDASDFLFYEKMKVPPPTFCPQCRLQRRLMIRNERGLYKRKCDLCGKDVITIYAPEKPYTVYCNPCWWSEAWDPGKYGQEYDPKRNFFEQLRALSLRFPRSALVVDYPTMVNTEYANHAGFMKNCYLLYNGDYCENTHYATLITHNKDSLDANMLGESELCYEVINCGKCSRVFFSEDCVNCLGVYFSKDLVGCTNCFGCINLRNKSYFIFNKPYSKEAYEEKLKEFRLDSFAAVEHLKKELYTFWVGHPHKFMHGRHNVNVSGDYVYESKNAQYMHKARFVEDGKFCQLITLAPVKDVYDYTEWGQGAQRIYESITAGLGSSDIRFSYTCSRECIDIEYSMGLLSSQHMFGCVGLRNKQYCILNKQYAKEEYEKLREKIIQDMNERPYIDSKGRVFKYGEFFPYELSLFDYNETTAMEYYLLSKEEILERGWRWREPTPGQYKITLKLEDVPDSIFDVQDSIVNEVIACSSCGRAYRIIKPELELLRRFGLPVPRKCPECRHKERFARINPPRLWQRQCAKCGKELQTSYAPKRPEIVYCEECYQQEVI